MEPWNIRSDDQRTADGLPTFIIFCEDETSEPIYFKYFETAKIKVNVVEGQKSNFDNVVNAIAHCKTTGLIQTIEGAEKIITEDTRVWCVFDFDEDSNAEADKKARHAIKFDESIAIAEDKGIQVAWSNDCFELWVLLHFEDLNGDDPANKQRDTFYNRLTEIFKNRPNPNEDLVKALKYQKFAYKTELKRESNFRSIVREAMIPNTAVAIERARALIKFHLDNKRGKPSEKSPCTLIYLLVEELIKLGGKQV